METPTKGSSHSSNSSSSHNRGMHLACLKIRQGFLERTQTQWVSQPFLMVKCLEAWWELAQVQLGHLL